MMIADIRLWQFWKGLKEITAVVAYEDHSTGSKAHSFCQRLSRELGHNCQIIKNMWLLNELRAAPLRSIAADGASRAHLVIISVHHGEDLPEEVRTWIELWIQQKGSHPIVLVALLDPVDCGTSRSMQICLQQTAKRENMEFVFEAGD
jgi:hypothetical protein